MFSHFQLWDAEEEVTKTVGAEGAIVEKESKEAAAEEAEEVRERVDWCIKHTHCTTHTSHASVVFLMS